MSAPGVEYEAEQFLENGMVIVMLSIHGKLKCAECDNETEAEKKAEKWIEEAKQSFPNGCFTPFYCRGVKLEN